MVGRPIQRSISGRGTLPEVRKWSRDPPVSPELVGDTFGGLEVVGVRSRRSESDRWTHLDVRKWSRDLSGGPELVGNSPSGL